MVDLNKFTSVIGKVYKGQPTLSFPKNKNIALNAKGAHFFNELGIFRVALMIDDDKKTVVVVADEDGCLLKPNSNSSFSSVYLSDLIRSRYGDDAVRFIGEFNDKQKLISFDITKPIYY